MATSRDSPTPSWLVQEPEGHGAPKTPGHWKTMWASDCARLEDAHQRGDAEVLVYGRKYVVDMKERTVRALYWDEKPAVKPVIRATYFLAQGSGWLPYSEKDAEQLEDAYAAAKVQLRSKTFSEAEIPLSDGENKVVMTKVNAGESVDDYFADFDIELEQKPVKAPSMLVSTIYKTAFEVRRGTPEAGGWGGVSATDDDIPLEGEPPKHLVFVIHGIGESLWSRKSSAMASLRANMGPMRDMSVELLRDMKKAAKLEEAAAAAAAATESAAAAEKDDTTVVEAKAGDTKGAVTKVGEGCEAKREGAESKDSEEGDNDGDEESGEYVEFLPVEWFHQVHGNEAVPEGMIQDITLNSIPAFRDFASQAIMDVMYYLTPDMQMAILKVVGEQMNEMWKNFCRFTPDFSGKVSIMGHSLGSIIAHDILMAQPVKGETQITEDAVGKDIPLLSFYPEVLLACGSPIGMFLSLRQSTINKKRLFKFNTTNRFFNLNHLHDPVAYRLEPLLDKRLRDLEPLHVPHRGGDRIHVSVKKINRGINAAIGRMSKSTGKGWNIIQSSINTTIKSAIGDPGTADKEESVASEEVTDAEDELDERIDWVIQESTLEGMHPWASAVFAHSSYFTNFDVVMFLVNRLNEGLEGEGETEEGGSKESEEGTKADEGSKAEEKNEEGSTREEKKELELVA